LDENTHVDRSCPLLASEPNLRDRLASQEAEILSLSDDGTIVCIGCSRSRLIFCFQRDGTVKSIVCVSGVRLRLCADADAVPAREEVV
jgi:hypothetical protein